jgi:hypothetical protein
MLNGNDYYMKTYIADIIPRIQRYSKRSDQLTMLTNQHWISINDITDSKTVYFFDSNGELDIFENGFGIDSGTWRLLDSNSLKLRFASGIVFASVTFRNFPLSKSSSPITKILLLMSVLYCSNY